jgi:hypothetical protein
VLLGLGLVAGCGENKPAGPTEGTLLMVLATPHPDDGALLVRIVGEVTGVRPVGGLRAAWVREGNIARVVVTGDIAPGPILELTIPDIARASSYSAGLEQAASRMDYALRDPARYTLVLVPQ